MSGSIRVELGAWPIVLHVSEGSPGDDEVDEYMRQAARVLARGEPHVVVMDSTRLEHASPYSRVAKKAWLLRYEAALRAHCLGTAVVLDSPLLRFISSTLMLVRPFPTPYYVCETREEALAWARQRLREAGVVEAAVSVHEGRSA